MKKYSLIGALLLFSLSLSSCSNLMSLKEFDIDGVEVEREDYVEYFEEYDKFNKDETYEIDNKWYNVSSKEKNKIVEDELTTENETNIKEKFYYSRFEFENKIELNIKKKETVKGVNLLTDEEVDEEVTYTYDIVFIKGITYIKHAIKGKTDKGSKEEIQYNKFNDISFSRILSSYLGLPSLDIAQYFYELSSDIMMNLDNYTLYQLDNGLAYSLEDYNDYNDYISKFYFETMKDSYQPKVIKRYDYLKGRYYTDEKDTERYTEKLLVVKTKLAGCISEPSDLSKY